VRATKRVRRAVRVFFVVLVGLFLASPLLYLVSGSLMSDSQINSFPPQFLPHSLNFGNFSAAWSYIEVHTAVNSVIFTGVTVGLQWALCIAGGFALAKLRFRGATLIIGVLALSLFVPTITTLVPTFIVTDKLHLLNTYPGLILPIAAQTGFGTLLFRQFIVSLPTELIDAARLDGAQWRKILRRIIVPLAKPATGAYVAISVLTAWNLYLWPLVVASKPSVEVLTETLAPLASNAYGGGIPENVGFAATLLTTLPMIIAFIVAQKAFVRQLSGSGVE